MFGFFVGFVVVVDKALDGVFGLIGVRLADLVEQLRILRCRAVGLGVGIGQIVELLFADAAVGNVVLEVGIVVEGLAAFGPLLAIFSLSACRPRR